MFSLTPGADPKKKPNKNDPTMREPLDRNGRKQAKQFSKGVTRFLRYNKDLLSEEKFAAIKGMRDEFISEVQKGTKKRRFFEEKSEEIHKTCKKSVSNFQSSMIKENIEVLFVAVVIAMGIRAYFIQQFKIPTGSMQPTLNGIIAYPAPEVAGPGDDYKTDADYKRPNPVARLIDLVWFGRSHVEWRAREDGDGFLTDFNQNFIGKNKFILFPRTYLYTQKGHKYVASGTPTRVYGLINQANKGRSLSKGDLIARGYIETGDMLIVNKMAYHWRKPKRGEVFVFNTKGIRGIEQSPSFDYRYGSQHYIKRLCGVPGDNIKIVPPNLLVDDKPAEAFGIKRVMSAEGLYNGYLPGRQLEFDLGDGQYLALGDNSANSLDSRAWGHVPEDNIVGKALFVFYPFGNHFGPIR